MTKKNPFACFGFTLQEATIYQSLFIDGPTTLATLANRINLHRPTVARALDDLAARHAVEMQQQGKRMFYIAASPAVFRRELDNIVQEGTSVIRELEEKFSQKKDAFALRQLEGKQAIKNLFTELVETLGRDEIFYRYIACDASIDIEQFVPETYRPMRDKKGVQQCAITSAEMKGKPYKKGMGCLWKTLPVKEDRFAYGVAELIFRDKVAFIDYVAEKAIVIQNPRLADFQRSIHKALYARLEERVT